jgi:Primase C terminal 2 (PriCT-2)/Family of unknown function (DUF5906)
MPYTIEQLMAAFPEPPRERHLEASRVDSSSALSHHKIEEIRSALSFIPPNERDIWLRIGMALHATGAEQAAFGLWDEWSRLTDEANYDPEDQRRVWNSFGKSSGAQTTLGSLFDLAKEHGWVRPGVRAEDVPIDDLVVENELRLKFEERIEGSSDFAELVYVIVPEIKRATLRDPSRQMLLKKAAKMANLSVRVLEDQKEQTHGNTSGAYEDPKLFMAELNSRYAVVAVNGKVQVMNEESDPELSQRVITYSSRTDFLLRYENRFTWSDGEKQDIATYWLRSPTRRQYEGVAFAPGREVPPTYYNIWQGWSVPPDSRPSCQLYLDFIAEVICGGNAEAYAYVWGWMCHLFQRPWELPGTTLVLRGLPGSGKNTFVGPLAGLIGSHYIELSSVDQLVGRFSGHMADKLLVFANEALWGGDKSAEGTFKALVTDHQSAVESKHRDIVSRANFKRTIIASNEAWCAPKGKYDRRLAVLDVIPTRLGHKPYFEAIRQEMRKGGTRRLLHEMLTFDLSTFVVSEIPRCLREAGWDMAVASMRSVERWWVEVVTRGYLYFDQTALNEERRYEWPHTEKCDRVRSSYLAWCRRNNERHIEHDGLMGKTLAEMGVRNVRRQVGGGRREHRYQFPAIEDAQRILSEMYAIPDSYWNPVGEDE